MPVKLTPKGDGFALKPSGKGGDAGTAPAGEEERVQVVRLHYLVDAVRSRERDVLGPIRFVPRFVCLDVHLVGDVEVRLPVLDRAGLGVRQVPLAKLGQSLDRR